MLAVLAAPILVAFMGALLGASAALERWVRAAEPPVRPAVVPTPRPGGGA